MYVRKKTRNNYSRQQDHQKPWRWGELVFVDRSKSTVKEHQASEGIHEVFNVEKQVIENRERVFRHICML